MTKRPFISLVAAVGGMLCAMGSDCLPDPAEMCTTEDLPTCNHYGEQVAGVRPNCTCTLFGEVQTPEGDGDGRLRATASPGWSFEGISASVSSVALANTSSVDPRTSQPVEFLDVEQQGGVFDFAFSAPDPSIYSISELSKPAVLVSWDGPLTVTMTNPQGEVVTQTLPKTTVLPVSMNDDCETRTLTGDVNAGPLRLEFIARMDSPGCD